MPSHRNGSASSDDEEAPESLSLTDSKRDVKKQADILKQFQAAEKEKKRARNRQRDGRLKEQAESSRRRRKEAGKRGVDLETRMIRAMEEAEAESEDCEDEEESQDIITGSGDDQGGSESNETEDAEADHDSAEDDDSDESHSNASPNKLQVHETGPNPNHLPEHLFASAFTSQKDRSLKSLAKRKTTDENPKCRVKKRARNENLPRDRVVGPRIIRTLAHDQHPSGGGTIPSSKVKKFIDRSLALRGGNPRARGWERRAANIGSMRRNGPAPNFVRNC